MDPQRPVPEAKSVDVKLNEIPEFLRSGDYFRSFREDISNNDKLDAEALTITVPGTCFRTMTSVSDANDLHHLLSTLRFWLVDVLPDSVIACALNNNTGHSFSAVAEPFMNDMPKLKVLHTLCHQMGRSTRLITAMNESSCEEIVEYLFNCCKDESPLHQSVANTAAALGSIKYLRYAHEQECPWTGVTCFTAALKGHLNCLKYAHEHQCPLVISRMELSHVRHLLAASLVPQHSYNALVAAALGGNVDCLQYALDSGCLGNRFTMIYATRSGQLECVKCLRKHGCAWDVGTFATAAKVGNLDIMKYLHRESCPWDSWTTLYAAANGHTSCLEYAISRGCPVVHNICYRMFGSHNSCFRKCQRAGCLKYLHTQGYKISGAATTAAKYAGDIACVEYIASTRKRGRVDGRKTT